MIVIKRLKLAFKYTYVTLYELVNNLPPTLHSKLNTYGHLFTWLKDNELESFTFIYFDDSAVQAITKNLIKCSLLLAKLLQHTIDVEEATRPL
ncbi:hypothetical protein GCM10007916_37770 [Psychromonas marina]|uniref:Uncharacterized protein n=1 Tax=Psychromonas marina TaxID=88364 RepID=A0ABQ6E676_9GAMM|nr:hypothetical protein GCM10007916_37770 [Psychromonas marina]